MTASVDAKEARGAFADRALTLATALAGSVRPFVPGARLTRQASWFTTPGDDTLIVVVGPHESPGALAEAVAYAVAWQHDADLALVLPKGSETPILHRLAFLAVPVRIWTHGADDVPTPAVIPARDQVVAAALGRPLRGGDDHDLGQRLPWVETIVAGANDHWALVPAHRNSYLSWHCAGRQVLRLALSGGGIKVQAGVQYKVPPAGRVPLNEVLGGPATPEQRARIEAAIAVAVADRLAGLDEAHAEHQMQAALGAADLSAGDLAKLRFIGFAREYPAWRGDGQPGYVDFLAMDDKGRLHVVETKIGSDPMLVFQALDYAVWVAAHAEEICRRKGWRLGNDRVFIDFVVAPKAQAAAIGPYTAAHLEALAGDIRWQVHFMDDARAEVPQVHSLPRRLIPEPDGQRVATPVRPPRWAARVQAGLLAKSARNSIFHPDAAAALLPEARGPYDDLAAKDLVHPYSLHLRSSQAFALNLFAPLDESGRRAALSLLGQELMAVGPAEFEFSDASNRLAEQRPGGTHQTQVDVVLRGMRADGKRVVSLIEVKFTEGDFSMCSAYLNAANPSRTTCCSGGLFGNDPEQCFQLASHGAGRRLYDTYLAGIRVTPPSGLADSAGCLVRGVATNRCETSRLPMSFSQTKRLTRSCTPCALHPITKPCGVASKRPAMPSLTLSTAQCAP